jgi:tungstate transport system substrate-binding protein
MAEGHGTTRREIAWNDFLFVGPKDDPAKIAGTKDAVAALKSVAAAQAIFVSRGDNSGTNALELRLWKAAGITPKGAGWYRDIGGGMGAALNAAAAMNATTITDRGTWLSFRNRRDLVEQVSGDAALINRYDVIELRPNGQKPEKLAAAKRFADWLCDPAGQAAIGGYMLEGQRLFNPSAK